MKKIQQSALSHENWMAFSEEKPIRHTFEYNVYSDNSFNLPDPIQFGPYKFEKIRNNDIEFFKLTINLHAVFNLPKTIKTQDERYHNGDLSDEISALLSLFFGVRLKTGELKRWTPSPNSGVAINYDELHVVGSHDKFKPVLLKLTHQIPLLINVLKPVDLIQKHLLLKYGNISEKNSIYLIRAARLYQDGIWMAETQPELSWILLVSAVETAAINWQIKKQNNNCINLLKQNKPEIYELLKNQVPELQQKIAEILAPTFKSREKFKNFLIESNIPPPSPRIDDDFLILWENEKLKKIFNKIYDYRSTALHSGLPFPKPMCRRPQVINKIIQERPLKENWLTGDAAGAWNAKDVPILINTFEYIARYALLKWWENME